jgi:predicted transcriptional regulator
MIREKPGQPVKMASGTTGHNLSIYVDPEHIAVLEEIRWREHKSMSAIIRSAIQEYIKAHASGNDHFKLDNWQQDPSFQAVPTILADKEKWKSYLKDCSKEELNKIATSIGYIKKETHFARYGKYQI